MSVKGSTIEPPTESLGMEGETCESCGAELATDQRYCLNCGNARTERRVDYEGYLGANGQPAANGVPQAVPAGTPGALGPPVLQQWSPITAIGTVALLGVMLLLGVLIGKDDEGGSQTVAAAAAPTTTAAAAPTATTASTTKAEKSAKGKGADSSIPGQGNVVQGGSGDTTGIAAADPNASELENAKNGPDVVATQGEKEQLDPNGEAGAGSDAVCIGC